MSEAEAFDSERASAVGYRIDPLSGAPTWIVPTRQDRPNLPTASCPFCVGGLEAPAEYSVVSFPNRWPPFDGGRAEIVLYTADHDASFADLTHEHARAVVDMWADRTAELGARDDVSYVLVFENRGPEVGATISHPHGQIYAFDVVPPVALAEFGATIDASLASPPADQVVVTCGQWTAWVPLTATWPYELVLAPTAPIEDLPSLDPNQRADLGDVLRDVVARLDGLFDAPMPFMMWFHQRPFDGTERPLLRVHAHIAPLLRAPGIQRFVAAGELGSGVWFNPVDPARAAEQLRNAK